ncbi:MAG: 3-isopropylmalate dehydrogenase, partial [Phycisphaerae bacterium]|nr:3-isopropylmalate dehydrogenase [Phycisphaerae bacterium]
VDKANVLETSRLWRETVQRVHDEEFPAVTLEHHLIDSAAMRVIGEPRRFDVILTENMFGDIISDEASVLAGSLGLLGSASVAAAPSGAADHRGVGGLYEPIHGSAPDIAGLGLANPIGAILSAAMLLDIGLGESGAGRAVERAARDAMAMGVRSADLGGEATTSQIGATVTEKLCRYASLRM